MDGVGAIRLRRRVGLLLMRWMRLRCRWSFLRMLGREVQTRRVGRVRRLWIGLPRRLGRDRMRVIGLGVVAPVRALAVGLTVRAGARARVDRVRRTVIIIGCPYPKRRTLPPPMRAAGPSIRLGPLLRPRGLGLASDLVRRRQVVEQEEEGGCGRLRLHLGTRRPSQLHRRRRRMCSPPPPGHRMTGVPPSPNRVRHMTTLPHLGRRC